MKQLLPIVFCIISTFWMVSCGAINQLNYSATLGSISSVANPGITNFQYMPDGHFAILQEGATCLLFWPIGHTSRSVGCDPGSSTVSPASPVLSAGSPGEFDNGGIWLYSVHRLQNGDLLGFYHAEDHEFPPHTNPSKIAWKSIARAQSTDGGVTWTKSGQIITASTPKPSGPPAWGGPGDHSTVWDSVNQRWVMYYSSHYIKAASSSDPLGAVGTWKKYYQGNFSTLGVGGNDDPLSGLKEVPGGNPSVHWNSYFQRWVMAWHAWDESGIWISVSKEGIEWESPRILVQTSGSARNWNPTLKMDADGKSGTLYYGYWPDRNVNTRQFLSRSVSLKLN